MRQYRKDLAAFITSCAHLSLVQEGAYNRLLDWYYAKERPLPSDIDEVCRLARAVTEDERTAVADVLREFWTLTDAGWTQSRADAEISRLRRRAEASRENGKSGGRPPRKSKEAPLPEPGPEMPAMGLATPAATTPYIVDLPPAKKRSASPYITFAMWREQVKERGEKLISDYKTVWEYADKVHIPCEFIMLAFQVFKDRHTNTEKGRRKLYRDWRLAFMTAVKANWYRLWRADSDGTFVLTSEGMQAAKEHERRAA